MQAESLTKRELAAAVLGTAVHAFSLASELSKGVANYACCIVPFALIGTFMLATYASTTKMRLLLLLQPVLTVLVWMHLMRGVPHFVHREADPLIAAIRQYRDMHGTYPPGGGRSDRGETPEAMRPYLDRETWCFYVSDQDDCRVYCHSLGFLHANYTFSTDSWWVGD